MMFNGGKIRCKPLEDMSKDELLAELEYQLSLVSDDGHNMSDLDSVLLLLQEKYPLALKRDSTQLLDKFKDYTSLWRGQ